MGKKVAIFSMTPLFPDFAMGGGQNQLKKIALHLGEQGHQLTILSTRHAAGSQQPFAWHENVRIQPVLRFKQPYPEPYFTPLYHIGNAMRYVGQALESADVHYSHDGGLIFPYVVQDIPTVISLRSIIYPETLQSALLFQGDEWILPSEHTRASYAAVVGQFAPAARERMHTIHNGFDWDFFCYTAPDEIFALLPRGIAQRPTLLFPHRPDPGKGIEQSLQLVEKLLRDYGWHDLCLLVPRWLDADTEPNNRAYFARLRRLVHAAGLGEHVLLHDWVSEALLPQYYSLADLTLCIGNMVETFGNTVFESLGCGTPVIAARVSTYRDLLPDAHIERVDYGDIAGTAALADAILRKKQRSSSATLSYLQAHFSQDVMVRAYADVILQARKRPPLLYKVQAFRADMRYQLAPWCVRSHHRGIYHDFRSDYTEDQALLGLLAEHPQGFPGAAAGAQDLHSWLDEGFVVPVISD